MNSPTDHSKHEPRVEDDALVRGHGHFIDDPRLPNQAYAAFVRSPHAHARVVSVNGDTARRAKGVLAVLTAEDIKAAGVAGISRHPPVIGRGGAKMVMPFRPVLAGETAMHVGDAVAMVVAETRAAAQDAAELVQVDYEELPAVVDLDAAMKGKTQLSRTRRAISASTGRARWPTSRTNATSPTSSPRRRMWRGSASTTSAWWWPRWKRAAPPASTTRTTTAIRCTPVRRAPTHCAARPPPSWACRTTNCG